MKLNYQESISLPEEYSLDLDEDICGTGRFRQEMDSVLKSLIGRENEISLLKDFVDRGAKIIVIQGQGGVGKTTLAKYFFAVDAQTSLLELTISSNLNRVISAEDKIDDWLKEIGQEPSYIFELKLESV